MPDAGACVNRTPDHDAVPLPLRYRPHDAAGRVLASLALVLACALIPRAGQVQTPPPGVFSSFQTNLVPAIGVALEPATMRSRVVGMDTQQVTAARLGQETLRLNLFDDIAVAVRIDGDICQTEPNR